MKRKTRLVAILGVLAGVACGARTGGGTDGSTHFWDTCVEDEECGRQNECVCGRCTTQCTTVDQCTRSGTACVPVANLLECSRDEWVCAPREVSDASNAVELDASIVQTSDAGALNAGESSQGLDSPRSGNTAGPFVDAGLPPGSCLDSPGCPWTSLAPAPFEYSRMSAVYDSKFYAFRAGYQVPITDAGFIASTEPSTVERLGTFVYDVESNRWSELSPPPSKELGAAAGVIAGKAYIVEQEHLFIYDIAADSWSEGPTPPERLDGAGARVVGNEVFYFGGNRSLPEGVSTNAPGEQSRTTYVYSATSNSWATVNDAPTSVYGPAACASVDRLFVFGAPISDWIERDEPLASLSYDPTLDAWRSGGTRAAGVQGESCAVLADGVYVFGGWLNGGSQITSVSRYSPNSDTWEQVATLPGTSSPTVQVIDGSVYVLGYGLSEDNAPLWRFTPQP